MCENSVVKVFTFVKNVKGIRVWKFCKLYDELGLCCVNTVFNAFARLFKTSISGSKFYLNLVFEMVERFFCDVNGIGSSWLEPIASFKSLCSPSTVASVFSASVSAVGLVFMISILNFRYIVSWNLKSYFESSFGRMDFDAKSASAFVFSFLSYRSLRSQITQV